MGKKKKAEESDGEDEADPEHPPAEGGAGAAPRAAMRTGEVKAAKSRSKPPGDAAINVDAEHSAPASKPHRRNPRPADGADTTSMHKKSSTGAPDAGTAHRRHSGESAADGTSRKEHSRSKGNHAAEGKDKDKRSRRSEKTDGPKGKEAHAESSKKRSRTHTEDMTSRPKKETEGVAGKDASIKDSKKHRTSSHSRDAGNGGKSVSEKPSSSSHHHKGGDREGGHHRKHRSKRSGEASGSQEPMINARPPADVAQPSGLKSSEPGPSDIFV
jgi:hypothetical protein